MANQSKRSILNISAAEGTSAPREVEQLQQANGTETPYIGVPFAGVISLPLLRYAFSDTKLQEQQ